MFDEQNHDTLTMNFWPLILTEGSSDGSNYIKELQVSLVLFCVENLQSSYKRDVSMGDSTFNDVRKAMSICKAFVRCSPSSLPKQQRLIDDFVGAIILYSLQSTPATRHNH